MPLSERYIKLFGDSCSIVPSNISKIVVGLSGGADSVSLLHLLCTHKNFLPSECVVEAVYVHHGLNPRADNWSEFCHELCKRLNVPFTEERVKIERKDRNIEAQAREKRYAALASHIDNNSLLATAHHQNDLAETFFLALKRGAGLPGLSSMGLFQKFGSSFIWRPLLDWPRAEIEKYVSDNNLGYITDDSNFDVHYDRNFLRHEIIPKLTERFPEFLSMIKRSASFIYEAQVLVNEIAEQDLNKLVASDGTLDLNEFRSLTFERQNNVLRKFIHERCGKYPTVQLIEKVKSEVIDAAEDSVPMFSFEAYHIRRYKDRLYVVSQKELKIGFCGGVKSDQIIEILGHRYQFKQVASEGIRLLPGEQVVLTYDYSFSTKIHPHNRTHSREIKKLFGEYNVPVWQRKITPLIMVADNIAGLFPNHIDRKVYTEHNGWQFVQLD